MLENKFSKFQFAHGFLKFTSPLPKGLPSTLQQVGVDVIGLIDFAEFIFQDETAMISQGDNMYGVFVDDCIHIECLL